MASEQIATDLLSYFLEQEKHRGLTGRDVLDFHKHHQSIYTLIDVMGSFYSLVLTGKIKIWNIHFAYNPSTEPLFTIDFSLVYENREPART